MYAYLMRRMRRPADGARALLVLRPRSRITSIFIRPQAQQRQRR